MTKKLDPDRPNKARRGRPPKIRTNSAKLKAIWATPEGRAKMLLAIAPGVEARRLDRLANPEKYKRTGVPHGYTKKSAARAWAKATKQADRYIKKMADEGVIPQSDMVVPDSDEAKGIAALHAATVLALGPGERSAKLAAIRTVLEWTRAKPASSSKITVNTSEQWLAEIAADDAES